MLQNLACLTGLILPLFHDPESIPELYSGIAKQLIEKGAQEKLGWERLAYLGDHFPARLSGSQNLEKALDWLVQTMQKDGFDSVRKEKTMIPCWVRGEESAELVEPVNRELFMLGLGGSVGTDPSGITAEALVVKNFEELDKRKDKAKGKIVVYNVAYTGYGPTVRYRGQGASYAAKYGAVAALVRSVTPRSLRSPHTGAMHYDNDVPKIPTAAITIEDAEMLQRMQDRGEKAVIRLKMGAKTLPDVESANIVAEIRGREKPEEVVVMGGHIDSWDVGSGVIDDGGGCVAAWEALRLIRSAGLKPRRTLRVVLWVNEENGLKGATAYHDQHQAELKNHVLAIELDSGIFKPKGFGFTGAPESVPLIEQIASLLEPIGANKIEKDGGGADISPLMKEGVPAMDLKVANESYFDFHHTHADSLDKLNPQDLAQCASALAVMSFVVADMEQTLPHYKPEKKSDGSGR